MGAQGHTQSTHYIQSAPSCQLLSQPGSSNRNKQRMYRPRAIPTSSLWVQAIFLSHQEHIHASWQWINFIIFQQHVWNTSWQILILYCTGSHDTRGLWDIRKAPRIYQVLALFHQSFQLLNQPGSSNRNKQKTYRPRDCSWQSIVFSSFPTACQKPFFWFHRRAQE